MSSPASGALRSRVFLFLNPCLRKRGKMALLDALKRLKSELLLFGFISLLLTFAGDWIICIPRTLSRNMLPCPWDDYMDEATTAATNHLRRHLLNEKVAGSVCKNGTVPLIPYRGMHQLHIFIFFLGVAYVVFSALTFYVSGAKMRTWKEWEKEASSHKFASYASKYGTANPTSQHASVCIKNKAKLYTVSFFRQFLAIQRTDYLILRQGFIAANLYPEARFDFQRYVVASLEDDFKDIVHISVVSWVSGFLVLLGSVYGWDWVFWTAITIRLVAVLVLGTALMAIVATSTEEIKERHSVIQRMIVMKLSDEHFWLRKSGLVLHLIKILSFQNTFEITHMFWIWYVFGLRSCFHRNRGQLIARAVLGVVLQFVCCYTILPIYALVSQTCIQMKQQAFEEQMTRMLEEQEEGNQQHTTTPPELNSSQPTKTMGSLNNDDIGNRNNKRSKNNSAGSFVKSPNQDKDKGAGQGDDGEEVESSQAELDKQLEQELRRKMLAKQNEVMGQSKNNPISEESEDVDMSNGDGVQESEETDIEKEEDKMEDRYSIEDADLEEEPEEFARKLGFSTQAINEMNMEKGERSQEAEGKEEEDGQKEKSKQEKKQVKAGKGKNKHKLTDDAVDEARRSVRHNTEANTMEKAVDLAKKKNLESVPGTKRRRAKPRKSEDDRFNEENNGQTTVSKRLRRAAACSNFKEKASDSSDEDSLVPLKEDRFDYETEAVRLTRTGPEDKKPRRKLLKFILRAENGDPAPFEMSRGGHIHIKALIMPLDDGMEKDRGKGVCCSLIGPVKDWAICGYKEGTAEIWLSTERADYKCVKPNSSYMSYFEVFSLKARVCVEVYRKLARSAGGNPSLALEELLASVVRSINSDRTFKETLSKDFVFKIGEFIHNQLAALDHTANNDDEVLSTLPVLVALRDECRSRMEFSMPAAMPSDGTLKIKDGRQKEAIEDEDEDADAKLARLLQEVEEWTMTKQRSKCETAKKSAYIKISEAEIADDYPLPEYYKRYSEEVDEYIFDSDAGMPVNDLPVKILNNWALYNSDSRLISLELIPMTPDAENDIVIFGSGSMREDDGSFCSTAEAKHISSSSSKSDQEDHGIPIYLSPIKQWVVEFGDSVISINIRTGIAWYKLRQPTKQYAPWCDTVLKTARLGVSIITLLEQSRASKLTFADVIKKVAEFESEHPAFISEDAALVERYVVVHGQIIRQQFALYPNEFIQRCAFITGLAARMEDRRHTKLSLKKKPQAMRGDNLNPSAKTGTVEKRKLMRATTTMLISMIWGGYYATHFPEDFKEGEKNAEPTEIEEEEEHEDAEAEGEDEVEEEHALKTSPSERSRKPSSSSTPRELEWKGQKAGKTESGESLYKFVRVGDLDIVVGGAVTVEDDSGEYIMCFVEYMYEKHDGTKMIHGRVLLEGSQTVLGDAAKQREVFLTNDCSEFEVADIKELVTVNLPRIPWGHEYRKMNLEANRMERANEEERKKIGLPMEYICKSFYCPEKGAFFSLSYEKLGTGTGTCRSCEERGAVGEEFKILSDTSFLLKNVTYSVQEFIYVRPAFFSTVGGRGTDRAGRNVGLKPYVVCHLQSINAPDGSKKANPKSTEVSVRRLYRPEDISSAKAYTSDIREVYYSEDTLSVPVAMIEGKCEVTANLPNSNLPAVVEHAFYCDHLYDPRTGALKQLPTNVKLMMLTRKGLALKKDKGKQICDDEHAGSEKKDTVIPDNRLATLDIFAGCGGLSEGLQISGASHTKWAIEYEGPAGQAFGENHPEAAVFVDNCNVILKAIMDKCGDADDCISTSEASEQAAEFTDEKIKNLPVPGEVEFINGGPPCQGFSGMNRFNQSTWSKVQCEMILAFLSFADYFRPRFFLLENVRNFVSFNKGQTFRLTLASLLEMGYQVRFGILEAGAFGVAQSRKRAFIWAAAPGETLPDWPEPMHVFASPELKISLPDGKYCAAAKSTAGGAPFRAITVRDTIGDLPAVKNGASKLAMQYESKPVSWFQKKIRGNTPSLSDHIAKEMNELNLLRCKHIPKRPGCDWHDLPDEKVKLSTGQMAELIPWCLPNTAQRHNQWKGLYGRLDWEGNFPTSVTDPQPMGKVGMCFHPDQDRIITVRECARSQGFPDGYRFAGSIQNKHRQIGNAVPPPLAYALGRKLKQAIDAKI